MSAYLRGGLPQVWLANVRQRQLEVVTDQGTAICRPGDAAPAVEGVTVDLAELFAGL